MQWANLLRSTKKPACRISSAIIELDDIIERCRLAIAEIGRSFGYLAKSLGTPPTNRNVLAAKVAIASRSGIVAEVAVNVEVSISNCRIANQRLVEDAAFLRRIGVR